MMNHQKLEEVDAAAPSSATATSTPTREVTNEPAKQIVDDNDHDTGDGAVYQEVPPPMDSAHQGNHSPGHQPQEELQDADAANGDEKSAPNDDAKTNSAIIPEGATIEGGHGRNGDDEYAQDTAFVAESKQQTKAAFHAPTQTRTITITPNAEQAMETTTAGVAKIDGVATKQGQPADSGRTANSGDALVHGGGHSIDDDDEDDDVKPLAASLQTRGSASQTHKSTSTNTNDSVYSSTDSNDGNDGIARNGNRGQQLGREAMIAQKFWEQREQQLKQPAKKQRHAKSPPSIQNASEEFQPSEKPPANQRQIVDDKQQQLDNYVPASSSFHQTEVNPPNSNIKTEDRLETTSRSGSATTDGDTERQVQRPVLQNIATDEDIKAELNALRQAAHASTAGTSSSAFASLPSRTTATATATANEDNDDLIAMDAEDIHNTSNINPHDLHQDCNDLKRSAQSASLSIQRLPNTPANMAVSDNNGNNDDDDDDDGLLSPQDVARNEVQPGAYHSDGMPFDAPSPARAQTRTGSRHPEESSSEILTTRSSQSPSGTGSGPFRRRGSDVSSDSLHSEKVRAYHSTYRPGQTHVDPGIQLPVLPRNQSQGQSVSDMEPRLQSGSSEPPMPSHMTRRHRSGGDASAAHSRINNIAMRSQHSNADSHQSYGQRSHSPIHHSPIPSSRSFGSSRDSFTYPSHLDGGAPILIEATLVIDRDSKVEAMDDLNLDIDGCNSSHHANHDGASTSRHMVRSQRGDESRDLDCNGINASLEMEYGGSVLELSSLQASRSVAAATGGGGSGGVRDIDGSGDGNENVTGTVGGVANVDGNSESHRTSSLRGSLVIIANAVQENKKRNIVIVVVMAVLVIGVILGVVLSLMRSDKDDSDSTIIRDPTDNLKFDSVLATVPESICFERNPGAGAGILCTADMTIDSQGGGVGNLVAKALLSEAEEADICIINSGAIRDDIRMGNFTPGDVLSVWPFENKAIAFNLSGHEIVKVLEQGFAGVTTLDGRGKEMLDGAYPYAAGLRYDVNMSAAVGSRLLKVEMRIPFISSDASTWTALDLERRYVVVVNSFIAAGGDTYDIVSEIENKEVKDLGTEVDDALVRYAWKQDVLLDPPLSEYSTQLYIPHVP